MGKNNPRASDAIHPEDTEKVKRRERSVKESTGYINGCIIVLMVREILSYLITYLFDEVYNFEFV